jgi:hypothetical protein
VRVQPQHADAQWIAPRPRFLEARDQAGHRGAGREQADSEVTIRLVLPDDVGKMA